MFKLCEHGYLPAKFKKLKHKKFLCPSCIFGKQRRRPWRTKKKGSSIRNKDDTKPGKTVSVDQLISAHPGLVPRFDGKHDRSRITAVTVFFDHFTNFSYCHLMRSTDTEETLAAKLAFEKVAQSYGVNIERYHADNGRFAEKSFKAAVEDASQKISFCGVDAHHQAGIIERHIQELTKNARTLLLHAKRNWPDAIGTILWPFAIKAAERRHNLFRLDDKGNTPLSRFADTQVMTPMEDSHTWGCPVYILEAKAAQGKMPKWEPRSRLGIYLGNSPCHAGSVALVLNPKTLNISPQYHVVFDDHFSTIPYLQKGSVPPHWEELVTKCSEHATDQDFDQAFQMAQEESTDDSEISTETIVSEGDQSIVSEGEVTPPETISDGPLQMPTLSNLDEMTCRRSSRIRKATEKAKASSSSTVKKIFGLFTMLCFVTASTLSVHKNSSNTILDKVVNHCHMVNSHFDGTLNHIHHMMLATEATNETFTFKNALKEDDYKLFIEAMIKEVNDHEERKHWTLLERRDMPPGTKTIMSIWSFKRKRFPDGTLNKHKARICAHGGQQTWGENYWETYAPVVNWITVRTLLALTQIHGLESRSVDFVLAFPQADLDIDVYMELPMGFVHDEATRKSYVLKLNKNLYGLKQAAYNWFEHLKSGLIDRDFKQSDSDCCLFIKKDAILLVYVDDCIIFARKKSIIDEIILSLKNGKENFDLTDEGDVNRFLGVEVTKLKKGSFELSQPFLIERLLNVVSMDDSVNPKPTPAVSPLLHKDLDGLERKNNWKYRQVIGMLGYLQGSTRPDISMAVHQCARFSVDPRLSHERAVKRICKYLLGTQKRGIIYKPDFKKGIEVFVDADFAGSWNKADNNNPENVLSRTGFVIFYAGCPILWSSKLQTEIALSTAEAEYIALSSAMREVIPLIALLEDISKTITVNKNKPIISCKVHVYLRIMRVR